MRGGLIAALEMCIAPPIPRLRRKQTENTSHRLANELAVELGDRSETAVEMQGVAMALAGCGHPARALRLGGAAAAEFEALALDARER